jgi:hypothetical protein
MYGVSAFCSHFLIVERDPEVVVFAERQVQYKIRLRVSIAAVDNNAARHRQHGNTSIAGRSWLCHLTSDKLGDAGLHRRGV